MNSETRATVSTLAIAMIDIGAFRSLAQPGLFRLFWQTKAPVMVRTTGGVLSLVYALDVKFQCVNTDLGTTRLVSLTALLRSTTGRLISMSLTANTSVTFPEDHEIYDLYAACVAAQTASDGTYTCKFQLTPQFEPYAYVLTPTSASDDDDELGDDEEVPVRKIPAKVAPSGLKLPCKKYGSERRLLDEDED